MKFLSKLLFHKNFLKKNRIIFKSRFIKIINPPKYNLKLKKYFHWFRNQIITYYEFPPLTKFNINKRFNKIIKNFDEDVKIFPYKVKEPIYKLNNFNLNNKLSKELNVQYGNICYVKLK